MLTIKAGIKLQEQKVDGTYNVKLRFTLNRQVKRLSTSQFLKRNVYSSKCSYVAMVFFILPATNKVLSKKLLTYVPTYL